MTGFNELVRDLIKHLHLCYQADDGTIWWYEGTPELLFKIILFLGSDAEEC